MIQQLRTMITNSNYKLKANNMKLGKYGKNKVDMESCVVATLYWYYI